MHAKCHDVRSSFKVMLLVKGQRVEIALKCVACDLYIGYQEVAKATIDASDGVKFCIVNIARLTRLSVDQSLVLWQIDKAAKRVVSGDLRVVLDASYAWPQIAGYLLEEH